MAAFTGRLDAARFTSPIDRKGRALISAEIRKQLGLRFGSGISVNAGRASFFTRVDERGRFGVPAKVRIGCGVLSGLVSRNGRGGVTVGTADRGSAGPGSTPGRGTTSPRILVDEAPDYGSGSRRFKSCRGVHASVAKLANAPDLGSGGSGLGGSTPLARTTAWMVGTGRHCGPKLRCPWASGFDSRSRHEWC